MSNQYLGGVKLVVHYNSEMDYYAPEIVDVLPKSYVPVTHPVTVIFTELPKANEVIMNAKVAAIDEKITEAYGTLEYLKGEKAKLLAIEHKVEE